MAVPLLERDGFLQTLDNLLCQVQQGAGRIALVSGEAGIGKTSLVEHFLQHQTGTMRVLWGGCEALFTPRPLGPIYDIAQQTQSPLRALLEGEANRSVLFAAVLEDLKETPAILIIEDVHWADEATLDLLKYLARRISRTLSLLILTFRDDEIARDHPFRLVLGDLPAREVTRLHLPPLSEAAVATLAQAVNRPSKISTLLPEAIPSSSAKHWPVTPLASRQASQMPYSPRSRDAHRKRNASSTW